MSWAGVALIFLAFVLFAVDLKAIGHGLPAVWGVLLLILGTLMASGVIALYTQASLVILVSVVILTALLLVAVISATSATRRPARTGAEGMIGKTGVAREPVGTGLPGWVFVHGERWRAILVVPPEGANARAIQPGQRVRVVDIRDGELLVAPDRPDASGHTLED